MTNGDGKKEYQNGCCEMARDRVSLLKKKGRNIVIKKLLSANWEYTNMQETYRWYLEKRSVPTTVLTRDRGFNNPLLFNRES